MGLIWEYLDASTSARFARFAASIWSILTAAT
jgi:hypothetical protein